MVGEEDLKQKMNFKCVIVLFIICTSQQEFSVSGQSTSCGEDGDCLSGPIDCDDLCGCDRAYYYNKTTGECTLKAYLMDTVLEKYHPEDSNIPESILAKTVRIEADQVFRGIIISAILFISCAGVCVLTSCVYCFRINYTDYVLKKDVKALAKKIGRDTNYKKATVKRKVEPIAENCPVVVENAGVFVV